MAPSSKARRRALVLAVVAVSACVGTLLPGRWGDVTNNDDVNKRIARDGLPAVHVQVHAAGGDSASSGREDEEANTPPPAPPSAPPAPWWPKFLHQSYKTIALTEDFLKWSRSVKAVNPDWTYVFWTDEDNRRMIAQHYPWFLPTYDGYKHSICRADAARYFYLHRYGGAYLDLDFECVKGLTQLVDEAGLGGKTNMDRRVGGKDAQGWSFSRWWHTPAGGDADRPRRARTKRRRLTAEDADGTAGVESSHGAVEGNAAVEEKPTIHPDASVPDPVSSTSPPSLPPLSPPVVLSPPPAPLSPLRRYPGDSGPSPAGVTLAVMGDGDCDHCIPNAFMMSEKGHPFWDTVFEELQSRARAPLEWHPEARTGPIMLKAAVERYANRTGDLRLLSGPYFYSVDWRTEEGQAVRTSHDLGDRVRDPRFVCGTFWTHGWSYYPDVTRRRR